MLCKKVQLYIVAKQLVKNSWINLFVMVHLSLQSQGMCGIKSMTLGIFYARDEPV